MFSSGGEIDVLFQPEFGSPVLCLCEAGLGFRYGIGDFLLFGTGHIAGGLKGAHGIQIPGICARIAAVLHIFIGFSQDIHGLLIIVGGIDIGFHLKSFLLGGYSLVFAFNRLELGALGLHEGIVALGLFEGSRRCFYVVERIFLPQVLGFFVLVLAHREIRLNAFVSGIAVLLDVCAEHIHLCSCGGAVECGTGKLI